MWDPVSEKGSMLSHLGDFWYSILSESDVPLAHALSHLPLQCRVIRQAESLCTMLTSGGVYRDNFLLIRFSDKDIIWYGKEDAIRDQHVPGRTPDGKVAGASRKQELTIPGHTLLAEGEDTDSGRVGIPYHPAALPNSDDGDITFAQKMPLLFGLKVHPDVRVTSIRLRDGRLLFEFQDFYSEFGLIKFVQNPLTLFPKMEFLAQSYDRRGRNLLCYPLGVDVYGPVDRILYYARISQSPKSLYLASCQAAGLPVVKEDCRVLATEKLHDGVIYHTDKGAIEADFPHTHRKVGDRLKEEEVIGSDELYRMYYPYSPLPDEVSELSLDFALPVVGLKAPNEMIKLKNGEGKFRPEFHGDAEALKRYHLWLEKYDETPLPHVPEEMNGIAFVRRFLAYNRALIACLNIHQMPRGMYLRLISFLRRELPLGSVLFTAPLSLLPKEENPVQSG